MLATVQTPASHLLGRTAAVLLIIVVTAACESAPAAISFSVRDSAGVRIVENGGEGNIPHWAITPDPILVIGQDRAAHEQWIAEVPFPDTKPPIEALRADRSGRLWVQETTVDSADPPRWVVYSAEGRLIGEASFPRTFNPLEIGEDYVLGVWRDEDDVEYVHVYGLDVPIRP
jgi:hypothetical protein